MILFVDDMEDHREVVWKLLRARGYPCRAVSDGEEALAFIRSYPWGEPLLVVLDSAMPGMSGINVLKAIRADPKIKDTHVVMFSAGFNLAHRDEAITLRASAWLFKGTDQAFDEICRWYERAPMGGASTGSPRGKIAKIGVAIYDAIGRIILGLIICAVGAGFIVIGMVIKPFRMEIVILAGFWAIFLGIRVIFGKI